MASSYSTDLKLELMVTGENAGTWGDITNTNLNLLQQAIAGYEVVSIAGGAQTTALVMSNATISNARNAVIKLTGAITGNQIVTVPDGIEKTYIVSNGTTGAFTVQIKTVSGTGSTFSTTDKGIKTLFADGTNINTVDLSTLSGQIVAAQITSSTITTTQLATGAVLSGNIASGAVTAPAIGPGAVTAPAIGPGAVTAPAIGPGAVGPTQLANTAVTAGSYTTASITVDAQGRITAASTGTGGGAGMGIPVLIAEGPSSGTYTASPTANRIGVYMWAGGGGGSNQRTGGSGGYGFYNKPITQPFSQPYAIGAQGNRSPGPTFGNSGGATNIANVGTVNAGGGATSNTACGSAGNAPGASLVGLRQQYLAKTVAYTYPYMCGSSNFQDYGYGVGGYSGPGAPGALVIFENTGT
jgi:hypothetical protein